jgi:hypothetical protein
VLRFLCVVKRHDHQLPSRHRINWTAKNGDKTRSFRADCESPNSRRPGRAVVYLSEFAIPLIYLFCIMPPASPLTGHLRPIKSSVGHETVFVNKREILGGDI